MWCLCRVSPLQISPVGVCPLQRSPYSGDYPQHLPGVGRSIQIRAATERHTRAQLVQGPRGLAQWTQVPPTLAPCTPQMALPLCQPPPGQPSTPYQQAVQLPGKSSGRGVSFDSSMDKTSPAGCQNLEDHGRQRTRVVGRWWPICQSPQGSAREDR